MKTVYKITNLDGSIRWTFNRPDNRVPFKVVGHVENNFFYSAPGTQPSEHPHGKPGTYQTWLSVIR